MSIQQHNPYSPLKKFNFSFIPEELDDADNFKLEVESVSWETITKKLMVSVRLFENGNHKKWFSILSRGKFTGLLELFLPDGSIDTKFRFDNIRLINTFMALSYLNPPNQSDTLTIDLTFSFESMVVS